MYQTDREGYDMEFTDEARQMVEDRLKAIMGRMTLSEKDRAEIEKELRSSIYLRAEAKASARGPTTVTDEDVKEALAEERAPEDIAACYTRSYAPDLPHAGFWPRLVAYIIDSIAIGMAIFIVAMPVIFLAWLSELLDNATIMNALVILMALTMAIVIIGIILCYYIVLEGRFGKTIGKFIMGLTVLKTNGSRIGYREALLRNIPKYVRNFLIIDTLIMLIFFNKEKQRGFDKIADTIVVHLR
jgi:uncharacterized RDD family membrane protein YckC